MSGSFSNQAMFWGVHCVAGPVAFRGGIPAADHHRVSGAKLRLETTQHAFCAVCRVDRMLRVVARCQRFEAWTLRSSPGLGPQIPVHFPIRLCFGVYTALLGQSRFGARSRWRFTIACWSQDSVSERNIMRFARCVEWIVSRGWWPGVSSPRPGGSAHLQASDRRPRFIFQSGYVLGCTTRCWVSCVSERGPGGGLPSSSQAPLWWATAASLPPIANQAARCSPT